MSVTLHYEDVAIIPELCILNLINSVYLKINLSILTMEEIGYIYTAFILSVFNLI